jgi:isoleucyl-tRNA synthetase
MTLDARWEAIRKVAASSPVRSRLERAKKTIGSSLEAPVVYVEDENIRALLASVDFADICITSGLTIAAGPGPADAFSLDDAPGIAVASQRAPGVKCARSWRYFDAATADPEYPDVTPRDARALRELAALGRLG